VDKFSKGSFKRIEQVRRDTGGGLSPSLSTKLNKRLRKLDREITFLDQLISRIYIISSPKLVKKREKLDQKRKEVRNKLKYGA